MRFGYGFLLKIPFYTSNTFTLEYRIQVLKGQNVYHSQLLVIISDIYFSTVLLSRCYEPYSKTTNFNSFIMSLLNQLNFIKKYYPQKLDERIYLVDIEQFSGGLHQYWGAHQNWGSVWKHFGGAHLPTPQAWKFSGNNLFPKPKKTVTIGCFRQ